VSPHLRQRSILFVDDEPALLDGLRRSLRAERECWTMRFATGGAQALELLGAVPADVVVADMRMPGMDGLSLLTAVKAGWPNAARIVLSGYADLAAVAQASAVAHQYLLKPCDGATLRGVLERTLALQAAMEDPALRRMVGGLGSLPAAPQVYHQLTMALGNPDVTVKALARIVQQDASLAARVLQFVNSAYYGLARRVSGIEQAVAYLGLNTLRHLTLTIEVQRSFSTGEVAPVAFEAFERHGALTARIARRIAGDPVRGEVAFAAGLLHDAGKLVLASRVPEAYAEVLACAERDGRPHAELERERLGADHASLGGYLLGLWGLPHAIVEAVAFHHDEDRLTRGGVDVVEAVGAADLLAHAAAGEASQSERSKAILDRMVSRHQTNLQDLAMEERRALEAEAGRKA